MGRGNATKRDARAVLDGGLLTVDEVAKELKVGRTTVKKLIAKGKLPRIKILNCTRIARADLEAYLADAVEG